MTYTHLDFCSFLDDVFTRPRADKALRTLAENGTLEKYLPEVTAMQGVEQPEKFHPEGDVFEHTMLMLSHIAYPEKDLGWSVLLHDVGKKASQTFDEEGVPHFYGHESIGADMAEEILSRLGFEEERKNRICNAVRNHMRFAHIDKMKAAKWKRFVRTPGFDMELELHRIDCISSNGLLGNYILMLDRIRQMKEDGEFKELIPYLSGHDLLAEGMVPGPEFSKILKEALQKQKSGIFTSRQDALDWLKKK